MKNCKSCGLAKDLSDFRPDTRMVDGHYNQCRECQRIYNREYRARNQEAVRAASRDRANKRYWDSKETKPVLYADRKEVVKKSVKAWAAKNHEKTTAHSRLNMAVKRGDILKQPCRDCGSARRVSGHHEDYSRALDVIWLCPKHHGERHRVINEERRTNGAANV